MASKTEMADALVALQVIISVDHKDSIKNRKHTSAVPSKQGAPVKDNFDKIPSTVISKSLTNVFDEATGSKNEGIKQASQVTRCKLFIWDNRELVCYLEENLHGGIELVFNIFQNADIIIQANDINRDKTKKREETVNCLDIFKQGLTYYESQTLQILVNTDEDDSYGTLLSPYSRISGATTNLTALDKCCRVIYCLDCHILKFDHKKFFKTKDIILKSKEYVLH